ncbi:MAG: hypothetical protein ACOYJB_07010 [Christensenellaceae bacterium]|jgi:hypothetical protein
MIKYSHVERAEEAMNQIPQLLHELQREVGDQALRMKTESIEEGQMNVDIWLSNVFTNLSVRDKIRNNAGQMEELYNGICKVETILIEQTEEWRAKQDHYTKKIENYLFSL